tara:strand:+ start:320206 stop:321963 length:1758 start_codon:yes stop_codon:yes gene_type:complete
MASLFVVRGRDQGKHYQLSGVATRIGREATSDIQLYDSEASRSHAEIRVRDGKDFELIDLGSSNGTRINGTRVSRGHLSSGDRIEIGGTMLIFTGTNQPAAMEAAHGVDIVMQASENQASRIVSSMSNVIAPRKKGESDTASSTDADRSLEVMYLTAIAVGRTDDLDDLLNRILTLVFDWVEADRGCIMLRDSDTNQLRPAARCDRAGSETSSSAAQPISISHTILDYVLQKKEGVRTSDAGDDERFDAAASIVQGGVREALCVPLQGRYDIVGALYIDTFTTPGQLMSREVAQRFTDDHLRLITAIGHQAALAIEDTFYYSALVQSERLAAMGQTIATLSHHVKNILQGIRGGSYLIEAGLERNDTSAVRRGWTIVDRNQERISNLVMDMLTFSKEREPDRVEADLNETVRDVVELMQTRAGDMNVVLESDFDASLPMAYFDPEAMHRAILNLVTNAIDAASGNLTSDDETDFETEQDVPTATTEPRVFVTTEYDPADGWHIDVIDNGPGVGEEDREKIFSLFESKKGARGTGLGLPVSAKIMREHGGDIDILDTESGVGCCFRLSLPNMGTDVNEVAKGDTIA